MNFLFLIIHFFPTFKILNKKFLNTISIINLFFYSEIFSKKFSRAKLNNKAIFSFEFLIVLFAFLICSIIIFGFFLDNFSLFFSSVDSVVATRKNFDCSLIANSVFSNGVIVMNKFDCGFDKNHFVLSVFNNIQRSSFVLSEKVEVFDGKINVKVPSHYN